MADNEPRSLTPGFPTYRNARHFLRSMNDVSYTLYRSMADTIGEQRGSPQAQVDWADPGDWIPQRLSSPERELAAKLWNESDHELNPRHTRGVWYLTTKHDLLRRDNDSLYVTERGQTFLREPEGEIVAAIDSYEGVLTILQLVAEGGHSKRSELLLGFGEFCNAFTSYRSEVVIKIALYDRLVNLIERKYVARNGQFYEVTDAGLAYLKGFAELVPGRMIGSKQSELQQLAKDISKEARERLADFLATMDPFKFEGLIGQLLKEMGYENVEVTSSTNDKGVDVVADIEMGISSVREVIQVKRHRTNINRKVLDELRGCLHRFNAMRGTIITTGGFSKGAEAAAFERNAAPITLIDGEKLMDLLIQYGIGVTAKSVEYLEFTPEQLAEFETESS